MSKAKSKQEPAKPKRGRPRVESKIYKAGPGADYVRADDVCEKLGIRRTRAYELIRDMRAELIREGKLTDLYPVGRVPKAEFDKRCMLRAKGSKSRSSKKFFTDPVNAPTHEAVISYCSELNITLDDFCRRALETMKAHENA